MNSMLPIEIMEVLKRNFPQYRFFLTRKQEKTLFIRFACEKIVQNMIKNKDDIHLVLLHPEGKMGQQKITGLPLKEDLQGLGERLIEKAQRSTPLDYTPSPVTGKGKWGENSNLLGHQTNSQTELPTEFPIESLSTMVGKLLRKGHQDGMENMAGYLSFDQHRIEFLSSEGADLKHEYAYHQLETSSFAQGYEITWSHLRPAWKELPWEKSFATAREWLDLPVLSTFPESLMGTSLRVVLSPQAMAQLLAYAFYTENFSALSIREGTGPLGKFLGKNIFHELITIKDNPDSLKNIFSSFDSMGHKRRSLTIVEKGQFLSPLFNEREAMKGPLNPEGPQVDYFGHCLGLRESEAYPFDLEMEGGILGREQLWEKLGEGFYLHDVHYLSISDRQKMTLYGLTRGGFIQIQEGRPVRRVQNMRFELSLFELFSQVEDLGLREEVKGWIGSAQVPYILTSGIKMTQAAASI